MNGAIISACQRYRYRRWRRWDNLLPVLVFIMLNPITANCEDDDPTIRKCIGFAKKLGYGGIEVVNLYAFRATDPADLRRAGYPIGPENDGHIKAVVESHATGLRENVLCAWGANARGLSRPDEVLAMLEEWSVQPLALKLSMDGTPHHPLMLPYKHTLIPMQRSARRLVA